MTFDFPEALLPNIIADFNNSCCSVLLNNVSLTLKVFIYSNSLSLVACKLKLFSL